MLLLLHACLCDVGRLECGNERDKQTVQARGGRTVPAYRLRPHGEAASPSPRAECAGGGNVDGRGGGGVVEAKHAGLLGGGLSERLQFVLQIRVRVCAQGLRQLRVGALLTLAQRLPCVRKGGRGRWANATERQRVGEQNKIRCERPSPEKQWCLCEHTRPHRSRPSQTERDEVGLVGLLREKSLYSRTSRPPATARAR